MWIKWFRRQRQRAVATGSSGRRGGGGTFGREILGRLPAAIALLRENGEIIAALALRLPGLRVGEADPKGAAGVSEVAGYLGILVREIEAEGGILEARGRALENRLMALVERRARHRDHRVVGIIRGDSAGILRLPGGEHVLLDPFDIVDRGSPARGGAAARDVAAGAALVAGRSAEAQGRRQRGLDQKLIPHVRPPSSRRLQRETSTQSLASPFRRRNALAPARLDPYVTAADVAC